MELGADALLAFGESSDFLDDPVTVVILRCQSEQNIEGCR